MVYKIKTELLREYEVDIAGNVCDREERYYKDLNHCHLAEIDIRTVVQVLSAETLSVKEKKDVIGMLKNIVKSLDGWIKLDGIEGAIKALEKGEITTEILELLENEQYEIELLT